jgi:tRNA (mo5U34)-methyltransferase
VAEAVPWRAVDRAELSARVHSLRWHHAIDLGHGVVTPGLAHRFTALERSLPEMTGRSVLDIGAWDGLYSFLAEQRGASRVVALDHYVWGVDLPARNVYWDECRARGEMPDQARDETEFWRDHLPGRRSFDLAKQVLGSRVEPVLADFMTCDLDSLGVFDVVLHLGVLYHMREPYTALERLRRVTREVAVVETEGVVVPGHPDDALLRFFPGNELGGDYGNWFATSEAALHGMLRAAGFRRVVTAVGPPAELLAPPPAQGLGRYLRAARVRMMPPRRAIGRYRLVVHAFP